ncbi:MAG: hypothetical protein ACYDCG_00335 [Candidatus Acidiferrales bacterium]
MNTSRRMLPFVVAALNIGIAVAPSLPARSTRGSFLKRPARQSSVAEPRQESTPAKRSITRTLMLTPAPSEYPQAAHDAIFSIYIDWIDYTPVTPPRRAMLQWKAERFC